MATTTESVVTSHRISLSCRACGDTVATYRPVPPYHAVWCGRQCCFWTMLACQPEAQWKTYATVGGFQVWRQELEAAGVTVTIVERAAVEVAV
jgi:hypothetical protein